MSPENFEIAGRHYRYTEAPLIEYKAYYVEDPPFYWYVWETYDSDLFDDAGLESKEGTKERRVCIMC